MGRLCTIRLMFLNATYCISGSAESSVTSGGAIFLQRFLTTSVLVMSSICWRIICKRNGKKKDKTNGGSNHNDENLKAIAITI